MFHEEFLPAAAGKTETQSSTARVVVTVQWWPSAAHRSEVF